MKFCITFAGAVGSSKTPVAYALSANFSLPIFNNDAIRTEVIEDLGEFNEEVYIKRRNERLEIQTETENSFIYDASVDREWLTLKDFLEKHNYRWFIISLDLSKDLLVRLYKNKGYDYSLGRIDQLILDHQNFITKYENEIGLHISDANFLNRISLCREAVTDWLKK